MPDSSPISADVPPRDPRFDALEIVHVVRQYTPRIGGLEEFVAKLAAEQRGVFRRVRVVTCDRIFSEPDRVLPRTETIDGIEVERFACSGSRRYPVMHGVLGAISSADIVHVQAVDYAFDMLAMTRPIHRKPLIATTHGGFFHTSTLSALKKVWFGSLTRFSASRYDTVVCCSESDYARFAPIAGGKARLIMNGVDIGKFADASSPTRSRTMVTLGRFSSNKRLERLIDVVALLAADDPAWHLHICGVPSDVTVADLDALVAARAMRDHVTIHVGLPTGGLRAVIGQCSYFVSASTYEGFGLALIEAMSAGLLPVVHPNEAFVALAASHPGVALRDFGHPAAVADRLRALDRDAASTLPALRRQAMAAVREFAWSEVARAYEDIYAEALDRRVGTPRRENVAA